MIKDSTTIVGLVANHFKMTPQLMFSDVRKRHVIEARFFCLLMLHRYTKKTLEQIGEVSKEYQRFRALNHATVLHGIRKVQGEIDIYPSFKRTYEQLKRSIETAPEPMVIEEIDLLSMCLKQAS